MIRMIYFQCCSDRKALRNSCKHGGAWRLSVSFAFILYFGKSFSTRLCSAVAKFYILKKENVFNIWRNGIMRNLNILLTSSCLSHPECKKTLWCSIDGGLFVCLREKKERERNLVLLKGTNVFLRRFIKAILIVFSTCPRPHGGDNFPAEHCLRTVCSRHDSSHVEEKKIPSDIWTNNRVLTPTRSCTSYFSCPAHSSGLAANGCRLNCPLSSKMCAAMATTDVFCLSS